MFVKITDTDWFNTIRTNEMTKANFWTPGKKTQHFDKGELILFKQHHKKNVKGEDGLIVGGGYVKEFSVMPIEKAWTRFGAMNGASKEVFFDKVIRYRKNNKHNDKSEENIEIGCLVLEHVFCLPHSEYIDAQKEIDGFKWNRCWVSGHKIKDMGVESQLTQKLNPYLV